MSSEQTFPTPISNQINYPDILTQLWQGNPVAFIAGALVFVLVALAIAIVIVKIKMPQLAWALTKNNIRGGGPVIASIYENNLVKFFLPKLFQSGIAYDGDWFMFPKAYANSAKELSIDERELLLSACTMQNAPGQLYFNYSVQSQVINPKVLAVMQHERTIQKLAPGSKVKIPKKLLIEVLQSLQEEYVEFQTINICLPVNLKGIKTILPKSLRKFDLKAIENLVRDWVKGQGVGFNWALGATIIALIGIVVTVILHFV